MIVKTYMVIFILSITSSRKVSGGSSYSKVFVERDIPVEYYQYGVPPVSNAQFSQLSSVPVQNSLAPVSGLVPPCGSPCIVPTQTIAAVAPSANVLTYKSPIASVPVVITPSQNAKPTGYEYSYVVYDENTGDHKAQRELSDGSVVRGQYSFIQPDGYVREVHYVADDVKGFNAIVKNFLPVSVEDKPKVKVVEKNESETPCHEVKTESITESSKEKSIDTVKENIIELKIQPEENQKQEISENIKESDEKSKESKETKETLQSNESDISEEAKETEEPTENIKEKVEEESEVKTQDKLEEKQNIESKKDFDDKSEEQKISKESSEENSAEQQNELHENESTEETKEVTLESTEKLNDNVKDVTYAKYLSPISQEVAVPERDTLVSYNDIIRCVQAAINKANAMPTAQREEPSPLAYIILNKPC